MKRCIVRLFKCIITVFLAIGLIFAGMQIYGTIRRYTVKRDIVNGFYEKYDVFMKISDELKNTYFEGDPVNISQEISELGYSYIYSNNGVIDFSHKYVSLWTGSIGILRAFEYENIPSWYALEHIESEWYYYRMV